MLQPNYAASLAFVVCMLSDFCAFEHPLNSVSFAAVAAPMTITPCENFSGVYSGVRVVQTNTSLSSTPLPGTPYYQYGTGTGTTSNGNTYVSFTFAATNNTVWKGQFVGGCASIVLSMDKHTYQEWLQDDEKGPTNWTGPAVPPPEWTENLVLYEIAPKGFTSPNGTGVDGSGSGTFKSLEEKIPYLTSLGVTAVWLAGYCQANTHFFSIWSVYATERPDVLDPSLGSEADFKALISALHTAGIKVFLDVVTHGVTFSAAANVSFLNTKIAFQSSTLHGGAHGIPNPFLEAHGEYFFHASYPNGTASGKWLMAGTVIHDYNYAHPDFMTWWVSTWSRYVTDFGVDGFRLDGPNGISFPSEVMAAWDRIATAVKPTKDIAVFGEMERYHFSEHDDKPQGTDLALNFQNAAPGNCFRSVMFSCHDGGFDQGPGNYYGIKGSRAVFGYYGAFGWHIPVFFSGDEANLDPVYLPALQKGCYSGGGPGGWLYGSQIQWAQIVHDKAAMLRDVSDMLWIRRNHSDVLHANACTANVTSIASTFQPTDVAAPSAGNYLMPYARFLPGKKVIVIAANPLNTSSLNVTMNISVAALGFAGNLETQYHVQDLWNANTAPVDVLARALQQYSIVIPPDHTARGGVAVLEISSRQPKNKPT